MSELLHLDISRLLLAHAGLSLVSSLSNAPVWNLPLALYGLVISSKEDSADAGEAIRNFSLLFGVSALLDFFWLVGGNTPSTLAWFLIVLNFLLKPVTLLSALGHLRERGHHFDLPGGFSIPGTNNGGSGGFPPSQQRPNETLWSAPPQQSSYHQSSESFDAPRPAPPRTSAPPVSAPAAAPAYQPPSHGAEGGGYHTLE
ncbi:hypothetical protein BCR35DRAFT_302811 [Leucosporidium creatinivorum]|uniref:Uncharacterized protein n=1 Tax=Leucosporidium creatinivorum TaxID=106004 RepID=A0A1Y2FMY6_9BASI|nr:hypothetical protein BCR35DRAFT_302811 [Leucosporidium creatinivorum]